MFHSPNKAAEQAITHFWKGTFNARMAKMIDRNHACQARFHRMDLAQILSKLDEVRTTLDLAEPAAIVRMLAKNPDIIRRVSVDECPKTVGLFAYLPLNGFGAWTILTGRFDGGAPDPAWIVAPGDEPVAIAIWLISAPGYLPRMLEPIARLFRELCPPGCVILSYGATAHSASIQASLGFRPARDFYPEAPARLVAAQPTNCLSIDVAREVEQVRRERTEIRIARSLDDMMKVFAVRAATFQAEQFCPYDEEFDGNDFCATQFLALIGDDPAACIRIRYFGDFAKLERLAIRREYRSRRLSRPLVRAALDHCASKGFTRVYGHSRADLIGFWEGHGFQVMPDRRPFFFSDVEYVEIEAVLAPDPLAIRFGADPMVSIRPEGGWDEAGPLDLSLVRASLAA